MGIRASIARAILEVTWDAAQVSSITLLDGLKSLRSARYKEGTDSKLIVGTSSNGSSVTFSADAIGGTTPQDFLAFAQLLIELYRSTKTSLGGSPTDQQIADEMLKNLVPIRDYKRDFTYIQP